MASGSVNLPPGFELEQPAQNAQAGIKLPPGFVLEQQQLRPEGFVSSALHGVGLPASLDEAKGMVSNQGRPPADAAEGVYNLASNIGRGVARGARGMSQQFGEAAQNISQGGPILANVGKAASGYADMLRSVNPTVNAGATAGEQVQAGNYSGAAGSLAGGMVSGTLQGVGMERPSSVAPKLSPEAMAIAQRVIAATGKRVARGLMHEIPGVDLTASVVGAVRDVRGILQDAGVLGESQTATPPPQAFQPGPPEMWGKRIQPEAAPVQPAPQTPSSAPSGPMVGSIPRTLSGESVLNDALTGLDNRTLLQVARSRGIDVTREAQLKPGTADARIIRKIVDDFSAEELDNVRNTGLEISRFGPAPNNFATPKLAADAYHLRVLQTFFPDVKLNAAALKRVQAAQSVPLSALLAEK